MIFFSSADSESHSFLLTITAWGLYWWLVSVTYFCTSKNLFAAITVSGFSWPSIAFCSRPAYTSGKAIGVGLASSAFTQSTLIALGITRSFRPAMSSTLLIGRLLLVIWRNPSSQYARP